MLTRNIQESDYQKITSVIPEWWGGRDISYLLPRLFFIHFQNTSFVVEKDGEIIGFLVGFVSQSQAKEAYIHFVGVHPAYRGEKIAQQMYDMFFREVSKHGCHIVRCLTSPVNKGSIAFHTRMGFEIEVGDERADTIPVFSDYDGKGGSRVLFIKKLS